MLCSLVLAASMCGQLAVNTGNLWTGNGYVLTTIDTSKPLKFRGGSITCDMKWNPGQALFESDPLDLGVGQPVRLQFYARLGFDDQTWGIAEVGVGNAVLATIGDYWIAFDAGTTGNPLDVKWTAPAKSARAPLADTVLWALQRAGVTNFTISQ